MKNNEEILKLGALLLRWHEAETKINPRSQGGEGVYRMEEADYEILTWAETRQLTHEKQ